MYDVICIGGGLNYAAAVILAKAGKKVALIEKNLNHIGGTCLHNGCIPSKNLLHRAKIALESKEEVFSHKAKVNFKKLVQKTSKNLEFRTEAILKQIKSSGVEIIEGEAKVTKDGIEVNGEVLTSTYTIIATGSRPKVLNFNYDKKRIITSNEALTLEEIPKEISVYGSGAIGLEMASLFASLGSKVNLIYRKDKVTKFHEKINENLEKQLREIGINLMPNTEIIDAKVENNEVIIKTNKEEFKTQYLLLALGREPNIELIQTDEIEVDKYIKVDDYFRTTKENIFAIGDVNGKVLLAHAARAEALNVVDQILGKNERLDLNLIPKFIYTLPLGYATIGETTENLAVFKVANLGISNSSYLDNLGIIVIYVDDDKFVKGAEIFAPNAEELIGIMATALAGEMDINTLKKAIFPHPTYSEMVDRVVRKVR